MSYTPKEATAKQLANIATTVGLDYVTQGYKDFKWAINQLEKDVLSKQKIETSKVTILLLIDFLEKVIETEEVLVCEDCTIVNETVKKKE